MTIFNQTSFFLSTPSTQELPDAIGFEVAFSGRSNAGKSSAINALCEKKKLAFTSTTPGRTQLINFFRLNHIQTSTLVDLPGYGYAKVSKTTRQDWKHSIKNYICFRENLAGIVLLSDIRVGLTPLDWQLIYFAAGSNRAVLCLLTKCDKLSRQQQQKALSSIKKDSAEYCHTHHLNLAIEFQLFSSTKKIGIESTRKKILGWLNLPENIS